MTNYVVLEIFLPGLIPDEEAHYTRSYPYKVHAEITDVSSDFALDYDCYSSQTAVLFDNLIAVNNSINASASNCVGDVHSYVGQFDLVDIYLQIQEFDDFQLG